MNVHSMRDDWQPLQGETPEHLILRILHGSQARVTSFCLCRDDGEGGVLPAAMAPGLCSQHHGELSMESLRRES